MSRSDLPCGGDHDGDCGGTECRVCPVCHASLDVAQDAEFCPTNATAHYAAPPIRSHAHVLPWDRMTPDQQADHLVFCHQFDADYFDPSEKIPDNVEARQFFLRMHKEEERTRWHADDHDPDLYSETHGSGGLPHVHDKEDRMIEYFGFHHYERAVEWARGHADVGEVVHVVETYEETRSTGPSDKIGRIFVVSDDVLSNFTEAHVSDEGIAPQVLETFGVTWEEAAESRMLGK